jgi:ATP-dependent helicase YprA (DUF1998 family)
MSMIEINPITTGQSLEDGLRRYIRSALPVNRNYPRLNEEIDRLLEEPELLLKGPFVEAVPDFPKGASLFSLASGRDPLIHRDFSRLPEHEFNRPLHKHQNEALQAIIGDGQNVIVATGTGSGKTECFLYPILDSLLRESPSERQLPGVRALLVYPMNALANDQLYKRVVPLFVGRYAHSGIKVGRFTGLTRDDTRRQVAEQDVLNADPELREIFGDTIPAAWQLTRQEMLANPPDVLITNYAMLEHLLLFPKNAPLLRHSTLRFLVLDEVHTYVGTQASEVALLLRKLRRRIGLKSDQVRCVGTSASLAKGEKAKAAIIRFASDLFGATFSNVIRGERQQHSLLTEQTKSSFSLTASAWAELGAAVSVPNLSEEETVKTWNLAVERQNLVADVSATIMFRKEGLFEQSVAQAFANSRELRLASESLTGSGAMPFTKLATLIFPDEDTKGSEAGLSGMIAVGIRAKVRPKEFSLLPARYHFFVNGVNNITVRLDPGPEGFSEAFLGERFSENGQNLYGLLVS